MLKIGMTGGIACGKSVAGKGFAALGIVVIDADDIAREVVRPGTPGLASLVKELGNHILTSDGSLDRKKMRAILFSEPASRKQVEQILHPLIGKTLKARMASATGEYCVAIIPLLVESDFHKYVDRVLVIDCPADVQRQRLAARDNENALMTERILASQVSREQRLRQADDIIENTGSIEEFIANIHKLHEFYLKLAADPAKMNTQVHLVPQQ